ncbi:MAG TPA: adenylate/guanylate cyclase domain-containing protein [Marmoricola sp.]|nr:adenylate/guanylate cyclase domain-containing protein [Marmoricola sp.]
MAERRLTSVLFADLVSYTTLSESRDTEDVRELLSQYFDVCSTVVRRHGGTVEKFIGDAVMAVWGVPTAHEDDAERAVRAALELVSAVAELGERLELPQLAVRAGVVTGEVAANLSATDQGMVAGDPVNTAARVQAAAGAGQVWVDETTRNLTSAAVSYADMGLHELKGKAEPVQLYRAGAVVAAIGGLQRVDGLEAPLTGRDRELRQLKDLFHATEESGRPRLVVVDGEPGVGKSRLGWEFEKYIDGLSRATLWHRGRCPSYGEGVVYWALNEAVRARLGLVEDDAGAGVTEALDRFFADRVPDEAEAAWLRPRLASLVGEDAREFSREDLFAAWTRFFDRVGGGDPVVLLIEDAQYADEGLLAFVEHLVANATGGCFVLLLARPELMDDHPQLGGRRGTVVRVEPLPDSAMRLLVEGLVDDLSDEVRSALVARAEGVPLYAVETVRALIDRDLVTPQGGRYAVASGAQIDLSTIGAPESLHALVAARLDALAPEERRVLTSASVLGQSFTREGIALVAEDVPDLEDVLARLQRKELLTTEVDRFSAERGQFRFVQSVVQQVAYATLSRRERKTRHLQVADHFAADVERAEELAQVIARHLLDAAEAAGPEDAEAGSLRARAAELLLRAGDRAAALGAPGDALRFYDTGLSAATQPRLQGQVLTRKARVLVAIQRYQEAEASAAEALEVLDGIGDARAAAEAAYRLCAALMGQGRHDEVPELARGRLSALPGTDEDARVRGRLMLALAEALTYPAGYDQAAQPVTEALHLAEQTSDKELLWRAMRTLAHIQGAKGARHVARLLFDGTAVIARETEDWEGLAGALANTALLVAPSDLDSAVELTLSSIAAMTDHGLRPNSSAVINLVNQFWLGGRWDAIAELRAEITEAEEPLFLRDLALGAVASLCAWAGREIPGMGVSTGELGVGIGPFEASVEGAGLLRAGQPRAAVHQLCLAVEREVALSGYWDDFPVYWPLAMRTALDVDDAEALAALWAHRDEARKLGPWCSPAGHATVFEALLELRAEQPDVAHAEQLLRDGIAVLDTCGVVVWRAHAQEDLGRLLLAQGRADEAAPFIEAARETYAALGASSWLARVESSTRVQA